MRVRSGITHRACLLVVAAAMLMFGACQSTAAPTTTTSTTSTTTSTIIGPATATVLSVGQTQVYSLIAGSTTANVLSWTSSNSGILAINGSGLATGIGNGVATITVSLDDGTNSTISVQVVPNYQGLWAGNLTVTACTDIGGFASAGYCAQVRGAVQKWTLTLLQSGLTLSGTLTKSEGASVLSGNVTATVGGSGDVIAMTGPLSGVANGTNLVVSPISWDSFSTGATMTGNWSGNVTSPQVVGNATVQWSLTGSIQSSTSGRPAGPVTAAITPLRRPAHATNAHR